ncbi:MULTISPECIES: DUF1232 domain-containing protein [Oceanobacillus]|uniref:Helix-turn-helix domain protein n=2 Tax=Oceanobacillus TaxID=182709 RepID=A0A0A1MSV0_9BACI|nr:DUF1232 domain-containing protein [Oceanobacillus oncorhynchi]MDM8101681.1 DUF1232 domain-containing protein [Oceanobacillus oncorhynchi]UUI41322.1 DUF1232 domain-containing protein [Oceanobacillus oncorhynchi]CEI82739.1 Helix-turn-helix domain protein [Oceanobacillus oncorhynchi]
MSADNFGNKLKMLLHAKSMTVRKCSEQTGIDKGTISRIINGKRKANIQHLKKFASCFDIPLIELLHAAGYSIHADEAREISDMHTSIEEIQQILKASDLYNNHLSTTAVEQQLDRYEQNAQTEEGKQIIHNQFKKKLDEVGSIGPFINQLKDFYAQFAQYKRDPFTLAVMGGVLLYFITPFDVVPDYIFPIGYMDDAIAVQIALKKLSN